MRDERYVPRQGCSRRKARAHITVGRHNNRDAFRLMRASRTMTQTSSADLRSYTGIQLPLAVGDRRLVCLYGLQHLIYPIQSRLFSLSHPQRITRVCLLGREKSRSITTGSHGLFDDFNPVSYHICETTVVFPRSPRAPADEPASGYPRGKETPSPTS